MKALTLCLLPLALVACKKGGGESGPGGKLVDAAQATIPQGWTPCGPEVGFTIALPPGWTMGFADRDVIHGEVETRNENAWGIMNERKADVNRETSKGIIATRSTFTLTQAMSEEMSEQKLFGIREELGKNIGLDEAVARWRDTLFGGSAPPPIKEGTADLPVGKAKTLTATSTVLGFIEKVTVYVLVDGQTQYTLFFEEMAFGKADPIPVQEIMQTFRPVR